MSHPPAILVGMTGVPEPPEGWRVDWQVMPVRGWCDWGARRILLHPGLTSVEARCVLAHEVVHAERGPFPEWARAGEEQIVSAESARRLIPLDALGEALAWSRHLDEVADELWVDRPTLEARLASLHPAERAHLRRRLAHQE